MAVIIFLDLSSIKNNQSDCEADEREEKQANGCHDIEHIHNFSKAQQALCLRLHGKLSNFGGITTL